VKLLANETIEAPSALSAHGAGQQPCEQQGSVEERRADVGNAIVPDNIIAKGQVVEAHTDFLEYQDDPEVDGHANSGFLVVHKGEFVHALHVGSAETDDADWIYGEVVSDAEVKRTGWLPTKIVK